MRPALRAIRAVGRHDQAAGDIEREMRECEPGDPRKHELLSRLLGRRLALWSALIGWASGIEDGETLSDEEAQTLLVAWAVGESWRSTEIDRFRESVETMLDYGRSEAWLDAVRKHRRQDDTKIGGPQS